MCVSMNTYTCMGISYVCGYMRCLSQNVYTAASTVVARVGGCARKTEGENQGGGGDQWPPLGLGNIDLPSCEKKKKMKAQIA